MPIGTWGSSDLVLAGDSNEGDIPQGIPPATLHTEVGDGNVQVQRRDAAGTGWFTIETLTEDTTKVLDMENMPALQIIATGTAQFLVIWDRHGV